MNTSLLVLQWVVSLIGVFGGVGLIDVSAFQENWKLGVLCFVFPPFPLYYVPTRWVKCRAPFAFFTVALRRSLAAATGGSGTGLGPMSKHESPCCSPD